MIDVEKHVAYWRTGAEEDWSFALEIIERRPRYALFFAHLALEKALKAHVCRTTQNIPPKIHNLLRLADIAGILLTDMQKELLGQMNEFQLEGRYPDMWGPQPSRDRTKDLMRRSEEMIQWLMRQL